MIETVVKLSVQASVLILAVIALRLFAVPAKTEIISEAVPQGIIPAASAISEQPSLLSTVLIIWLIGLTICSLFFIYTHFKYRVYTASLYLSKMNIY